MIVNDTVIKSYENLVYRVIHDLKYIPNNVEFEDLAQVGRISLWKALESYKGDEYYTPTTHCYRIINGDIIDFLRKAERIGKNESCGTGIETCTDFQFEEEVVGNMLVDEMAKHIAQEDVDMFVDKHVNRLSFQELIEKYGHSKSTIIRKLDKAKEVLKNKLEWERDNK